jgi:signal recognition particle subunit SRP54
MFESLGDRLQNALQKMKGYGKITEENVSDMMREIRLALLEADVNYTVVKEFTNNVKEKALGEEVKKSLKPGEVFVKIVKDELTELLGGEQEPLNLGGNPAILMLVGLQGSGKTTTIGKLANLLRKKHSKKPLLVACDVYRPAAIDQLKQIGKQLNIEVYDEGKKNPVDIAEHAIAYAKENKYDIADEVTLYRAMGTNMTSVRTYRMNEDKSNMRLVSKTIVLEPLEYTLFAEAN